MGPNLVVPLEVVEFLGRRKALQNIGMLSCVVAAILWMNHSSWSNSVAISALLLAFLHAVAACNRVDYQLLKKAWTVWEAQTLAIKPEGITLLKAIAADSREAGCVDSCKGYLTVQFPNGEVAEVESRVFVSRGEGYAIHVTLGRYDSITGKYRIDLADITTPTGHLTIAH